jgi:hypothetical protein
LEAEAGESRIQGQFGVHSEFEVSLGYTGRPCLKNRKKKKKYILTSPLPQIPTICAEDVALTDIT